MARGICVAVAAGFLWLGLSPVQADPGAPASPVVPGPAAVAPGRVAPATLPPPAVRTLAGHEGSFSDDLLPPPAEAVRPASPRVLATGSPDAHVAVAAPAPAGPPPASIRPVSAYLRASPPPPKVPAVARTSPAPTPVAGSTTATVPSVAPAAPAASRAAASLPESAQVAVPKPVVAGVRVPPATPAATLARPAPLGDTSAFSAVPAVRSGSTAASLRRTSARPPKSDAGDCKT